MGTGDGSSALKAFEGAIDGGMKNVREGVLHALVNSLPAYLYSVHYHKGAAIGTLHNPQCEKVTGYKSADYVNEPDLWLKMVHQEDRDTVGAFFNLLPQLRSSESGVVSTNGKTRGKSPICACNEQEYMLEHRIIHREGAVRWIANRCVPTRDLEGNLLRVDGLVMDITDQKAAEEEMAARLEKERQYAAEMESLKKLAEDAVAQNNRFMSLIVHDLRSPITSVITFLKLLERQCDEGDFGSVAEVIHRVGGINENLLKLIDELLNVSRLKNGAIHYKKRFFDALYLAQPLLDNFRLQAEMKGVELKCDILPGVRLHADFSLTREVLGNIVSNGIKFCGGRNTITVTARKEPFPSIIVSNDGPPISRKLLPKLFSFDETTSTPGSAGERGTGLGLPLSAEIMRMQGGRLRARNEPGTGPVFDVEFAAVRPVVLLVDDEECHRVMLLECLKYLDVETHCACNGEEALKIIGQRTPHLIISDLMMPVMDGYDLLRAVRKNPALAGVPFIALTSSPESSDVFQKVMALGADDFIKTPIMPDLLLPHLRRYVA